jgi:hypothetical protein
LNQEWDFDAGGFGLFSNLMAIKAMADKLVADQHDPLTQVFGAVFINPFHRFAEAFDLLLNGLGRR